MRVNKTNFHTKGFALGLALKQRRIANSNSEITHWLNVTCTYSANLTDCKGWTKDSLIIIQLRLDSEQNIFALICSSKLYYRSGHFFEGTQSVRVLLLDDVYTRAKVSGIHECFQIHHIQDIHIHKVFTLCTGEFRFGVSRFKRSQIHDKTGKF